MYTRKEKKEKNFYFKQNGSRISTRTTDFAEAKRFVDEYKYQTSKPVILTVADAIAAHQKSFEKEGRMCKQKKSVQKMVTDFFGHFPVNKVPPLAIVAYKEMRIKSPKKRGEGFPKGSSVSKELTYLRSAINFCHSEDYIEQGVTFSLKKVFETSTPRGRYFTEQEIKKILNTDICQKMEVLGILMRLAFSSAARKTALTDLTVDRLNFDSNLIDFRNPKLPKRSKPRAIIPFPSEKLKEDLRRLAERSKSGLVFEGHPHYRSPFEKRKWFMKKYGSLDQKIDYLAAEAFNQAGVNNDKTKEKACFHTIRHSAAVHMAKNYVPMKEISVYLGHATVAETERTYAKFHPDFMQKSTEAVARLID